MPSASPDRALRRLVAQLARAGDEDIRAVLAELPPRQREAVRGLLASHAGLPRPASVTPIVAGMADLEGVSPWLVERLAGGVAGSAMTETARAALQASAATLQRRPATAPEQPRGRTLLGQLRHGLARKPERLAS